MLMAIQFCTKTAVVFQFIGYVVLVLKIVIPSILIVLGVISLGKAIIAADDKEIKSAANTFIKKFIVAVFIFFIPAIISALFSFVGGFANDNQNDYEVCIKCISNPNGSTCAGKVSSANN